MQRVRYDLFPAAMLSGNQNVGIGWSNACDGIENRLHGCSRRNELGTALHM